MKQVLYLIITISLIACEKPIIERIDSKHPNGEKNKVIYYQEIDGREILVKEMYFHDNGKLKMEGEFSDGKREGSWKAYFENGQLQSSGTFKNGKRTEEAKVYYPNGKLRYQGHYKKDKEVGHWEFYNEKGKLVKEQDF